MSAVVTIDELVLADEPARWRALGFTPIRDRLQLGTVRLRLAGSRAGRGIVEWSLRGIADAELDGLVTTRSRLPLPDVAPPQPNGVVRIDHVVAMTPALDRSVENLQRAGLDLRRVREEPTPAGAPRQAFFRLGEQILEIVQEPEHVVVEREAHRRRGARLWGLALLSADLDRTIDALGEHAGEPRAAVQSGRRIVTVRRSAGLTVPVAVMSEKA